MTLRQQAEQHARRKLLTTLNSKERQAFTVVEDYCQQVKAIGQLARQFTKPEDWQLTQSKILLRDALAYRIVSDTATYDKALDFYQIGSVNSPLRNSNEEPTQDVITQSQARWHRLQIQAGGRLALSLRLAGMSLPRCRFAPDTLPDAPAGASNYRF